MIDPSLLNMEEFRQYENGKFVSIIPGKIWESIADNILSEMNGEEFNQRARDKEYLKNLKRENTGGKKRELIGKINFTQKKEDRVKELAMKGMNLKEIKNRISFYKIKDEDEKDKLNLIFKKYEKR